MTNNNQKSRTVLINRKNPSYHLITGHFSSYPDIKGFKVENIVQLLLFLPLFPCYPILKPKYGKTE